MTTPNDLPAAAIHYYAGLDPEQQQRFNVQFNAQKRSMPLMMALAIIFPIQLFFLGKVLLGVLFLITGGGLGVWYVIEWFLTPQRVRDYNTNVANRIALTVGDGVSAEEE